MKYPIEAARKVPHRFAKNTIGPEPQGAPEHLKGTVREERQNCRNGIFSE